MGLRLAGERSTWGGELGDWHLGNTLCNREVSQMIEILMVMVKGESSPERQTLSQRSRGNWREATAEKRRSLKFV